MRRGGEEVFTASLVNSPGLGIAVLAAELVAHYFPKLVELHNYSSANSLRQKLYNWATLNRAWPTS